MSDRYRRLVLGAISILIVGGASIAAWRAWDTGWIGKNPRAPTTENFLNAINVHVLIQSSEYGYQKKAPCVRVEPGDSPTTYKGLRDLVTPYSPGATAYSLTMKVTEDYGQAGRDQEIIRLDAMTNLGFFEVHDTSLTNTARNGYPAREYVLTAKGWRNSQDSCFYVGKVEVLGVVGATKVVPDPDGTPAYDVKYKIGVRKLDEWTQQQGVADYVSRVMENNGVKEYTVRLYRGKHGWIPESVARVSLAGGESAMSRSLDEILPLPSEAAIRNAISDATVKACLLLPSKPNEDAVELEDGRIKVMSASYYDGTDTQPESAKHKAWRRRLSGLAEQGLFIAEPIPADPDRNRAGGVRYTLVDRYAKYLDAASPGCLLLGEATIDSVQESDQITPVSKARMEKPFKFSASFRGLATLSPGAWSRGLDLSSAPEAKAYLEHGMAFGGWLDLVDGKWRLTGGKTLGGRPTVFPWKPFEASPYELMPKAAGGTEVHLISVYGSDTGIIDVEVKRRNAPIILVLSSYDAVGWRISVAKGAKLSHVVLMGYEKGMVFGQDGLKVTKAPHRLPNDQGSIRLSLAGGTWGLSDIERLFGRRQDSWQMAYNGRKFSLADYTQGGVVFSVDKRIVRQPPNELEDRVVKQPQAEVKATWGSAVTLPPGGWSIGADPETGQPTIRQLPQGSRPPGAPAASQGPGQN